MDTFIPACEEVYDKYTDTAGNLHWTGTQSGKHIIPAEEEHTMEEFMYGQEGNPNDGSM